MLATRQHVSGWGRYPEIDAESLKPRNTVQLSEFMRTHQNATGNVFQGICRGMGRSYGDSALAPLLIHTAHLDNFIGFDAANGVLHCNSGVSLGCILDNFAHRGWFLPVLPGTRHVTVGGAIASDVHGKNHHHDGCFSQYVLSFRLLTAHGKVLQCSATENSEAFYSTCGGMGLTGIVLDVHLQLRQIGSAFIQQRAIKTSNLRECFDQLAANEDVRYSVAWLDCMARGDQMGRSVIFLGEHCDEGGFESHRKISLNVPFNSPAFLLNRHTMKLFNQFYYQFSSRTAAPTTQHFESFFFPLDSISNWNRLYGRRGFLQYQFVLPNETAYTGMHEILSRITTAGKGSFLSVLKKLGAANENLLSFPIAGYTLALDFKFQPDLLPLLDTLDSIVLHHGGRLYLSKDARMTATTFKRSYPQWQQFVEVRNKLGASGVFRSLQSVRLGLDDEDREI